MRVGIVGAGALGKRIATELDEGKVPGARATALCSRDLARAQTFAGTLSYPLAVVPLQAVPPLCDLMIEVAGAHAVDSVVRTALSAGKEVMVLSCGALLDRADLFDLARQHGTRIHIPSGAIVGLDGLIAAATGRIDAVTVTTRKPPAGLRGAPGVELAGLDLDAIREPTLVFCGSVSQGYPLFPANVNVAAAVSMAGIGPHRTILQVIADPSISRNTHDVQVDGDFGSMHFHIENVPSEDNPRTGRLTALSILAYLRQLTSPLHMGI
ncbi:MAG: aspartate dehydrogenase [Chloroflexi bacterium]|nr:aspartate dehydrogenase [Chloroflexota bacterium]